MSRYWVRVVAVVPLVVVAGCSTQNASLPPSGSPSGSPSVSSSAGSGSASASSSGVGVSQQSNKFLLSVGSGVNTIAYSFSGNYSITADQASTWGEVTGCSTTSATCTIEVKAGRQDSAPVWQWFTANASGYGCINSKPCNSISSMNFALTGTLTINGQQYPLTLGQNGSASSNSWWYGGPGWTSANPSMGMFNGVTPDGKYSLNMTGDNDYSVQVVATS